jgi:hypothetical protein
MMENLRYTPTHASQQEPMKSTLEGNCCRTVSVAFVPRSRTITRTNMLKLSVPSRERRLSIYEQPSTRSLLLEKWQAAGGALFHMSKKGSREVYRAKEQRNRSVLSQLPSLPHACRQFLRNEASLQPRCNAYEAQPEEKPLERVRPEGFRSHRNQTRHGDFHVALKCSTAQFWCIPKAATSDCLPDVPEQLFERVALTSECPRSVRILEGCQRGS